MIKYFTIEDLLKHYLQKKFHILLEKLGQLIRALHISADPFFYPAVPSDNLDYQRLLVYLSECSADQITTILALVEAYLRTYKKLD